ncbi:MAG: flippase-like domain-containing protein [Candidatus Lambdaproteobacteria bacterium]|nr:flippase-like domain-containing protein [Candidatus Lambdaproteobacteria bacterium]
MRKLTTLLATLLITGAALAYAFWDVDVLRLLALLASGDYLLVVPHTLFLIVFYAFTGVRWQAILRPLGRYSLAQVSPAMMIGFAGNNVLPARLGEVVRAVVFARQYRQSRSAVLATLLLERLLDVFAILVFYFAAVLTIDPFPESIRLGSNVVAAVVLSLCAAIALFLGYPAFFLALWDRWTRWLPVRLQTRGHAILQNIAGGLSSLKSVWLVLLMLGYSLVKWVCAGGMVWAALLAFGDRISLGIGMIVIATTALAVTLPTAPGFLGAFQAAYVFALVPFGISRENAIAASLFSMVAQWIPTTATGAAYLMLLGGHWRDLRQEAAQVESAHTP